MTRRKFHSPKLIHYDAKASTTSLNWSKVSISIVNLLLFRTSLLFDTPVDSNVGFLVEISPPQISSRRRWVWYGNDFDSRWLTPHKMLILLRRYYTTLSFVAVPMLYSSITLTKELGIVWFFVYPREVLYLQPLRTSSHQFLIQRQ